jgi:DNA-binding transcriptional ArsR family regulator
MKTRLTPAPHPRGKQRKLESLDSLFFALSDRTRRDIVEGLAAREMSVTEIAAPHDISLPAISKHLDVLERAGLLVRKREGRTILCKLNPGALQTAMSWIDRYKAMWEGQMDSLGTYLDDLKSKGGRDGKGL